jgi:oligopeptide transport system substrate-binding protein
LRHGWVYNNKPNKMAHNVLQYQRIDAVSRATQRRAWNRPNVWPALLIALALMVSFVPAVFAFRRRERSGAHPAVAGARAAGTRGDGV